ncbi:MAG TPA: SMC-Scp complex subunit ScpB [Planctomycetaceae bacterium]|jgi:segregation and condensation protein B|nr:SMC-Scp complex subunit ScpB [Planctomycetaceae bacterium]
MERTIRDSAGPLHGPGATVLSAAPCTDERVRQFFRSAAGTADRVRNRSCEVDELGVRGRKAARLEALLFVSDTALSARRLAQLAMLADSAQVTRIIEQLNAAYDRDRSAYRIERAANGYLLLTRPTFAHWLGRVHHRQGDMKLSPPSLETLTVVAYRQPITRAEIEAVRGVQCAEMLKQLLERGLVRIAGEDNSLGRPYLYETTRQFLEVFGLGSLDELPLADRVRVVRPPDPSDSAEVSQSTAVSG